MSTSTEENKAIVSRYFEEAWGKGNLDVVDELMAPDYVNHGSVPGHPVNDREDMKRIEEATRRAFPDFKFEMHDMVAEGDTVVYRWTGGGTQQGEFMGIPPSGRWFSTQGVVFSRIRDGKIVEQRRVVDVYTMMQQLGAIPRRSRRRKQAPHSPPESSSASRGPDNYAEALAGLLGDIIAARS